MVKENISKNMHLEFTSSGYKENESMSKICGKKRNILTSEKEEENILTKEG